MGCQHGHLRQTDDVDNADSGMTEHHQYGEQGQDDTNPSIVRARRFEPQQNTEQTACGGTGHRNGDSTHDDFDDQSLYGPGVGEQACGELGRKAGERRGRGEHQRTEGADGEAVQRFSRPRSDQPHGHGRNQHQQHSSSRDRHALAHQVMQCQADPQGDVVAARNQTPRQEYPASAEHDTEHGRQCQRSRADVPFQP